MADHLTVDRDELTEKLGGALDAVAQMATESAKTYGETDDQLADKLRDPQRETTVLPSAR